MTNDDFKFIYLLGADNINFEKKDKFIVYQGSHGDKGAEIADIILPGAAYTEKNGLFINLEGKLQNAYKASYPPGDAREDWIILKDIANMIKKPLGYNNVNKLRELIKKEIQSEKNIDFDHTSQMDFVEKNISINHVDYYYTNVIARSSKVMNEIYKIIFLLLPILVSVALIVWLDRRVWAFVQKRRGPNVVGPFGILQTLADALKYIF